jgi:hypothetical protein
MCPPRWIDEVVIPSFETGLRRSGRQRSELDFLPTVTCAIDDDEARAMDAARRTVAFYSTVRTYKPLWEMHGFADAAAAAGEAFRRGDLAAVPEQIPDEMVDAYTAAGPLDKVRARVSEAAERGDGVWLTPATYFIRRSRSPSTRRRSSRLSAFLDSLSGPAGDGAGRARVRQFLAEHAGASPLSVCDAGAAARIAAVLASSSRRAIWSRPPGTGSSAGRGSISRWIRLRTWRAKWGWRVRPGRGCPRPSPSGPAPADPAAPPRSLGLPLPWLVAARSPGPRRPARLRVRNPPDSPI